MSQFENSSSHKIFRSSRLVQHVLVNVESFEIIPKSRVHISGGRLRLLQSALYDDTNQKLGIFALDPLLFKPEQPYRIAHISSHPLWSTRPPPRYFSSIQPLRDHTRLLTFKLRHRRKNGRGKPRPYEIIIRKRGAIGKRHFKQLKTIVRVIGTVVCLWFLRFCGRVEVMMMSAALRKS